MSRARQAIRAALLAAGAWVSSSCSPASFDSETLISTVRILASRASEPRTRPGNDVTVDVLAFDGRPVPQDPPARISWLRLACINPPSDAYYACFTSPASFRDVGAVAAGDGGIGAAGAGDDGGTGDSGPGGDAGAGSGTDGEAGDGGSGPSGAGPGGDAGFGGAGLAGLLQPGADLSPLMVSGSSFAFEMPKDVIIPRTGVSPSYGLAILFNFACTGTLRVVPYDPNGGNPQQIPIQCFNDVDGGKVQPDGFVFGFTRVYAYEEVSEVNPVITQVDTAGGRLDIDGGTTAPFSVPLCTTNGNCPKHAIGPVVPPPTPSSKQVWADFFSTTGGFSSTTRLLYNPMSTLSVPGDTNNDYVAPRNTRGAPNENFVWIVVHDDQGGASWVTVPLTLTP